MESSNNSVTYIRSFAGFIITYNRPDELSRTIDAVFRQSLTPEKLVIIDNGSNPETEAVVQGKMNSRLVYHRTGKNLGPAGGARFGLHYLHQQGYHYLYWGDDNDPPPFTDAFEKLIALIDRPDQSVGVVGMVGNYFDQLSGSVKRPPSGQLEEQSTLEVDVVSGNQCLIVSSAVLKKSIYPDENLFFGFEELDFCLAVQKAGFKILVSSELFIRCRKQWGRENFTRPLYKKKSPNSLWREYYSTRNSLVILKKNKFAVAIFLSLIRYFLKSWIGFRYGLTYGSKNAKMILKGIFDFFKGKMGQQLHL